mmetsp:Transcript_5696/g.14465  ORF Transcript_5696/g.14465 Transcript_5696/m.14465 type:complete len:245 (+) Transcript_5696:1649-2383(+)
MASLESIFGIGTKVTKESTIKIFRISYKRIPPVLWSWQVVWIASSSKEDSKQITEKVDKRQLAATTIRTGGTNLTKLFGEDRPKGKGQRGQLHLGMRQHLEDELEEAVGLLAGEEARSDGGGLLLGQSEENARDAAAYVVIPFVASAHIDRRQRDHVRYEDGARSRVCRVGEQLHQAVDGLLEELVTGEQLEERQQEGQRRLQHRGRHLHVSQPLLNAEQSAATQLLGGGALPDHRLRQRQHAL